MNGIIEFFSRKTTWAALSAIGSAIGGYATKSLSPMEAISLIVQAAMALGLRSAIATTPAAEKTPQPHAAAPFQTIG